MIIVAVITSSTANHLSQFMAHIGLQ